MNKKAIFRYTLFTGFLVVLAFILIPEVGSTGHTDWKVTAKTKMRSLSVLYATYTTSGARVKPLNTIEELKEFNLRGGGDLSLFSTYDPVNKRETDVVYFKPKYSDQDELIFVFEDPILRIEKSSYSEEDLKDLRYIACYTKSGIASLESKPIELNQSEQAELVNASSAAGLSENHLHD